MTSKTPYGQTHTTFQCLPLLLPSPHQILCFSEQTCIFLNTQYLLHSSKSLNWPFLCLLATFSSFMHSDGLVKRTSFSKSYLLSDVSQIRLPFLGSNGTSYTSLLVLPSLELKESHVSWHVCELVGETPQKCVAIEAKKPGKRNPKFCLLSIFKQVWWCLHSPQCAWLKAFPRRSGSLLGGLD